jgi:glucokinase
MILAADIGGTKTNIALFAQPSSAAEADRTPVPLHKAQFPSTEYPGFGAVAEVFLRDCALAPNKVKRACVGVAGPVVQGHVETPNLPWHVDARELVQTLGFQAVTLLNDLEATAERAATLSERDVFVLNTGRRPTGPLTTGAVIAAGTGLGMAILHPIAGAWWPVASEGGHVDLAPRNETEFELLRFLLRRHGRVSVERVVSGPGLVAVYDFFNERGERTPNPEVRAAIQAAEITDAPRIVAEAALQKRCPVADQALDQLVELYGAAAGNLALMAVATGGIFVGGGVAPKILERLRAGGFMAAFTNKGRLSPLLADIPVNVILDQDAGLLGAARRGLRLELGLVSET